ncbi:hypothetical protein BDB01DRAFT_802109 [Pilobolus umbonatus]|nr:hypothetical protein BDB01DRAFT_802109 [Pilobolus umbonatus]
MRKDPFSVDELLDIVLFPKTEDEEKKVGQLLSTLSHEELVRSASDGVDPLIVLNPAHHSVGYLYFIVARCREVNQENGLALYQQLCHFIKVMNIEQIRTVPKKIKDIASVLAHMSSVLGKPSLPILPLSYAIKRLTPSLQSFTSLHAPFAKACILDKQYAFPLEIINHAIEDINPKLDDIHIQSFLEYYYYSAHIYIANKQLERALDILSILISSPTYKAISAIQISAYKKYLLISLIQTGGLVPLPKYTGVGVEKLCRARSTVYHTLVKAFKDSDLKLFNDTVTRSSLVFGSDQHMGLVKQCFQALRRKKVKEMTKVYITVGLVEMAQKIGNISVTDLESMLVDMINQQDISATLGVTEDGIKTVHFDDHDQPQPIRLEDKLVTLTDINEKIARMDKLEGLNKEFQIKYMTLTANGGQMVSGPYDEDIDLPLDEEKKYI